MNQSKGGIKKLVKTLYQPSAEEMAISPREVYQFLRERISLNKKQLISLGFLLIVQAIVIGSSIWLLKAGIDNFFKTKEITLLLLALFLATVFKSIVDFLYNWIHNLAVARVRDKMILDAYSNLLASPFKLHIKKRNSLKFTWVLKDATRVVESAFGMVQVWIRQPVQMISSIVAVTIINWQLTLLGVIVIPLIIPCMLFFRRKTAAFVQQRKELLGLMEERVAESIYGIRIVKAFDLESREYNRINEVVTKQRTISERNAFYLGLAGPIAESLGLLSLFLILFFGINSIFTSSFSAGTFLAFILAFFNVFRPIKSLASGSLLHQTIIDSGRRLILLSKQANKKEVKSGDVEIDNINKIEYVDVWFSYKDDIDNPDWVLKNINFEITQGETILLTGLSGGGKSTLCDLLFRLFKAQRGKVLINGIPIESIKSTSRCRLFAMCSQESIIFSESLLENIRIARPNATREEVIAVAKIVKIPNKMIARIDDIVGDRGIMLSGGEKQRVALARAVLCKPQFMLLDEAMNNLDPDTEFKIWKNLKQYLPNCTYLVVSHRWLDLNQYDRLMIIGDGHIVENTVIDKDSTSAEVFERYQKAVRQFSD